MGIEEFPGLHQVGVGAEALAPHSVVIGELKEPVVVLEVMLVLVFGLNQLGGGTAPVTNIDF
mgnify:CR=1 FL=1